MKQYPAKLLLFGEHVLLLGATALAVPVPLFSGHWDWENDEDEALEKQQQLRDFACSPELSSIEGLDTEKQPLKSIPPTPHTEYVVRTFSYYN